MIVWVCVPVLPHASLTVHVLVIDTLQPLPGTSAPSVNVAVRPVEQLSVTVAVPKAALICAAVGLHVGLVEAVTVITGAVTSLVKLIVWVCVPVLPHASLTVHVLVIDTLQPLPGTSAPSVNVAVRPVEQLSVTVAVPKAALICAAVGLHVGLVEAVTVITGAVTSLVKLIVWVCVPVLPHASLTVHVLVIDTLQPLPGTSAPSVNVAVRPVEQLSVTVAVPKAALICAAVGLHVGLVEAVTVITGAVTSLVKLIVWVCVPVLPHASLTVHVLVIDTLQPLPGTSAPSVNVAVRPVEQLSVTVAVPKAALICAAVGLHVGLVEAVTVITGAVTSLVKLIVWVCVPVLPHASLTVHVLVIDTLQPLPGTSAPSVNVAVRPVEQLSVTVAVPKAALICAAVGLHVGLVEAVTVITGAVPSLVKLIVWVCVPVLPHASLTVHVLVIDTLQPLPGTSAPSVNVAVRPVEQLSVTVAVPKAALICAAVGLHVGLVEAVTVITGAVTSLVKLIVWVCVPVLPHASLTVHVLVIDTLQPLPGTSAPSVNVAVRPVEQLSVTVAVPKAALICAAVGLHVGLVEAVTVITGAVTSLVKLIVWVCVPVLPHASLTVHVLVIDTLQPLPGTSAPSVNVAVRPVEQLSVTVAVPKAALICAAVGLHVGLVEAVTVITGAVTSLVKLIVWVCVPVLPHASLTVHVLVIDTLQPLPGTSAPSVNVAVRPVEQLSVTVAVPKAALICAAVGLHVGLVEAVTVITGAVTSLVKLIVWVCVPVLPHASLTVHVLVIDTLQPLPGTSAPSVNVAVRPVEQLSVTVAVPKAALICAAVGLHVGLVEAVTVITGAVPSLVKLIVWVCVPVLPHASLTVHVLVIDTLQPLPGTSAPSVNVAVRPVEQLSVTVAVPKAALICAAVGLHVGLVEAVTVITGAVTSLVKLIVWVCVPVLPHASLTVHVLVIDTLQPLPGTSAPSVNVAVRPVEQLSVTVAVPKAALICAAVGLHVGLVEAVTVITGAVTSLVKLIVWVCVPVLPHASLTVHVLVIDTLQPLPGTSAPSVNVAVRPVEQLSVTVAVPKAALICAAVGLHVGLVEAVTVITGAVTSLVKLIVWVCVPVLPHASLTVHVLVIDTLQPLPGTSAPS